MNILSVNVPMPPSLSALTNNHGARGRIKSAPYKAWQTGASAILRAAWRAQGSPVFERHLFVSYHLGLTYAGDIANREKALTDLLVQTIPGFPDDRYIDRMEIERVPGLDGASIFVQQIAPPDKRQGEPVAFGALARDVLKRVEADMT